MTAEEWKRRFEREREKVNKLRQHMLIMDQEIKRWRAGEKLSESEWTTSIADLSANLTSNSDSKFLCLKSKNVKNLKCFPIFVFLTFTKCWLKDLVKALNICLPFATFKINFLNNFK